MNRLNYLDQAGMIMTIILNNVVKNVQMDGVIHPILKGIDLTINKGEFVSIVGRSGSGKSTLLNMMTLIDKPSSGEIIVDGTNLLDIKKGKESRWRGKTRMILSMVLAAVASFLPAWRASGVPVKEVLNYE
jgi:ABC-type lipoprotein export system ATPase subunit